MKKKNIATLILAGGSGERFGGMKQFTKLRGKEILFQTVDTVREFNISRMTVVVVPKQKFTFASQYYRDAEDVVVLVGGSTRYKSTKIGLDFLSENYSQHITHLFIHDGVRPFVSRKLFVELQNSMIREGALGAVPYLPITDSIISFEGNIKKNTHLDRARVASIQTPHFYQFDALLECFVEFADNEMENLELMVSLGKKISYVVGMRENIKLTHKNDLSVFRKIALPTNFI